MLDERAICNSFPRLVGSKCPAKFEISLRARGHSSIQLYSALLDMTTARFQVYQDGFNLRLWSIQEFTSLRL